MPYQDSVSSHFSLSSLIINKTGLIMCTVCRDLCLLCCRSVEYPPGASRQGEAPAGPIHATPTCRPIIKVENYRGQLTVTEGGLRGWRPLYSAPLVFFFYYIGATYLNRVFQFLKCYKYSSNFIFMFGCSGLHRVLRMTHLEAAPTMRITGC